MVEFQTLSTSQRSIPNDILGDANSPKSLVTAHSPENPSDRQRCTCQLPVYGTLHSDRHGNRASLVAFADEVHYGPVGFEYPTSGGPPAQMRQWPFGGSRESARGQQP